MPQDSPATRPSGRSNATAKKRLKHERQKKASTLKKRIRRGRLNVRPDGGSAKRAVKIKSALNAHTLTATRKTLTKHGLSRIIREMGLSSSAAARIVDCFLDTIHTALVQGVTVRLINIGTFEPYIKSATRYKHPTTGEVTEVPSRPYVRFKPAPELRSKLKEA